MSNIGLRELGIYIIHPTMGQYMCFAAMNNINYPNKLYYISICCVFLHSIIIIKNWLSLFIVKNVNSYELIQST